MVTPLARRVIDVSFEPDARTERWLWHLTDTRNRTLATIEWISQTEIDWQPPTGNAIGTLLYHIALIEADYTFVDILGLAESDFPPDIGALLPYPHRDDAGNLTRVTGVSLSEHIARLATVRSHLEKTIRHLAPEQLDRPNFVEQEGYETTPAWVVHHLIQHEAEHREEIGVLRSLAKHANIRQP